MTEAIETTETGKFEQGKPVYSGIRFEPGEHESNITWGSEFYFDKGRLDAHAWNPEVLERIQKYQPNILAIDGVVPKFESTLLQGEALRYSDERRALLRRTWILLPGRPNEINPRGRVTVVGADIVPFVDVNRIYNDLEFYMRKAMYDRFNVESTRGDREVVSSFGLGLLFANLAVRCSVERKEKEQGFTRRDFLRLGLGAVGFLAVVRLPLYLGTSRAAAYTKDEGTKNFLLRVDELVRPLVSKPDWVNFRTALLICKAEDSLKNRGLPKETTSIIMGYGHNHEANNLMESPQDRKDIIQKYAKRLFTILDQLLTDNRSYQLPQAREDLLDYLAAVELYDVRDPGGPAKQPNFPHRIESYISLTARFQSSQVEEALSPLRRITS